MTESTRMQTYTGEVFDFANPTPDMINIRDIAHALSLTCRYGGHCVSHYSVAQHSVHCLECARRDMQSMEVKKWALLHDASEAYIGDLPRAPKSLLPCFQALEDMIHQVIAERFNLSWPMPPQVKAYDNAVLIAERDTVLPAINPELWAPYDHLEPAIVRIRPAWDALYAETRFLNAFESLFGDD